jgi:hypothetical protein
MKAIQTKNDLEIFISDHRYEYLNQFSWHAVRYYNTYYAKAWIDGKKVYMHKLILPDAKEIDHVNRNGLDNRDENLREATRSQNAANKSKASGMSSKHKGVSWDKLNKKWRVVIMVDYKQQSLGRFEREEDAALAYNEKALELYGEFAVLNDV